MEEQTDVSEMGGTMRLGAYNCTLKAGSKVHIAYGKIPYLNVIAIDMRLIMHIEIFLKKME